MLPILGYLHPKGLPRSCVSECRDGARMAATVGERRLSVLQCSLVWGVGFSVEELGFRVHETKFVSQGVHTRLVFRRQNLGFWISIHGIIWSLGFESLGGQESISVTQSYYIG